MLKEAIAIEDNSVESSLLSNTSIQISKSIHSDETDDSEKITKNLSSLRFDANINDPERSLLFLRKRSQLLTLNIISHAVFTTKILVELKRNLLTDSKLNSLRVSIIGCGRIGTHLVNALLEYTTVLPENITISTPRPEEVMIDFQGKAITCYHNNCEVASKADILFLCFPPQHITKISNELKTCNIAQHCLIYSVIAGVTAKKLSDLIEHDLVIKPLYSYAEEEYKDESDWIYYTTSIVSALSLNNIKQITCPVTLDEEDIVKVDTTLLHILFLQMLNWCHYYKPNESKKEESVCLCNHLLFRGISGFTLDSIDQIEILKGEDHIYKISEFQFEHRDVMRLEDSEELIKAFEKHYKMIIDRFIDWREY